MLKGLNIKNNLKKLFSSPKYFFSKDPDYLVIGAGSAGCVIANRLSEKFSDKVLLIEAGKEDKGYLDSWKIQMPSALTYNLADENYNWNYYTEKDPGVGNRNLHWPRGKCLGGSSSLNAMVYIRGHAFDYDRWGTEDKAEGWSYKTCLPYFKKAQNHELGETLYRGGCGPLNVSRGKTKNKLFDIWIEAGMQAGYPFTNDMNGYQQEGFGYMDMTVHQGVRWNTANAYLRPALERRNLKVMSKTFVNKIIIDGKKAVGVEVERDGKVEKIYAEKEVILCGGALNSPQVLMLSGIGDADHLKSHGIEPVLNLPMVGKNLQDHVEVYIQYECKEPITLYKVGGWLPYPHERISAGLEWFLFGSGLCGSNHFESGGFIRTKEGLQHPDLQYHFIPGAVHGQLSFIKMHAFQAHAGTMRQKSRGKVELTSKNPRDKIKIFPNIYSHPDDIEDMVRGVRHTLEIFRQKSFDKYKGNPINFDYNLMMNDEKYIREWIRNNSESSYHCSCTNAMGLVTENDGRVKGIDQLRVVDASVMPSLASGNLNAPTIMMAERISDMIKGEGMLEPIDAPVFLPKNWKSSQR